MQTLLREKERAEQTMWIPEEVAAEMVRSPVQEIPVPGERKWGLCWKPFCQRDIYGRRVAPLGGWATCLSEKIQKGHVSMFDWRDGNGCKQLMVNFPGKGFGSNWWRAFDRFFCLAGEGWPLILGPPPQHWPMFGAGWWGWHPRFSCLILFILYSFVTSFPTMTFH